VFPQRRVTVYLEFTDVPEGRRQWWLVNDRGAVDLCPTDPGFPVDLYVTTDIRTMIAIWFGKLAWDAGGRSGKIEVIGPRQLRECLRSWFLLSAIRVTNDVATKDATVVPAAVAGRRTTSRPAAMART
jgi:hypothetical protein